MLYEWLVIGSARRHRGYMSEMEHPLGVLLEVTTVRFTVLNEGVTREAQGLVKWYPKALGAAGVQVDRVPSMGIVDEGGISLIGSGWNIAQYREVEGWGPLCLFDVEWVDEPPKEKVTELTEQEAIALVEQWGEPDYEYVTGVRIVKFTHRFHAVRKDKVVWVLPKGAIVIVLSFRRECCAAGEPLNKVILGGQQYLPSHDNSKWDDMPIEVLKVIYEEGGAA